METVEIMVYIAAALLAGAIVLGVTRTVDYGSLYTGLKNKFIGEPPVISVDKEAVASRVLDFWHECQYGEVEAEYALYVKGEGTLTRDDVIAGITKLNMCDVIGCGTNSQLDMASSVNLPKVLNIRCRNSILVVK
jgi:hypothetical protein